MSSAGIGPVSLEECGGDVLLKVRAVPGARRDRLAGCHGDALRVAVAAPPEKGKANEALARFLAATLGLKRSRVRLERGQASRDKVFRLEGVSAAEVRIELSARNDVRSRASEEEKGSER